MTLSILESKRLSRVVTRLVRAEIASSWRGASHPDNWPAIDEENRRAKKNFHVLLAELTGTLKPRTPK